MNEIREQLKAQKSDFVTRPEHDFVLADIRDLRESRASLEGKASQNSVLFAYLVSGIGILLSVVSLIIHVGVK